MPTAKDRVRATMSRLISPRAPATVMAARTGPAHGTYNSPPSSARCPTTPGGRPIDLKSLRGKVVLIDFWTYSCINCQRSLPRGGARRDRCPFPGVRLREGRGQRRRPGEEARGHLSGGSGQQPGHLEQLPQPDRGSDQEPAQAGGPHRPAAGAHGVRADRRPPHAGPHAGDVSQQPPHPQVRRPAPPGGQGGGLPLPGRPPRRRHRPGRHLDTDTNTSPPDLAPRSRSTTAART